ncbi:hypothetical protein BKA70DRAFT_206200 [Coprinopsis sp. MPI-PUGE-AT-0042]|nr:hypothetical protein BKA70DRAFT_206200 [Coprinopsis sp. MPI-PUGE-AT-0042]
MYKAEKGTIAMGTQWCTRTGGGHSAQHRSPQVTLRQGMKRLDALFHSASSCSGGDTREPTHFHFPFAPMHRFRCSLINSPLPTPHKPPPFQIGNIETANGKLVHPPCLIQTQKSLMRGLSASARRVQDPAVPSSILVASFLSQEWIGTKWVQVWSRGWEPSVDDTKHFDQRKSSTPQSTV